MYGELLVSNLGHVILKKQGSLGLKIKIDAASAPETVDYPHPNFQISICGRL